jgi:hypothetical protein
MKILVFFLSLLTYTTGFCQEEQAKEPQKKSVHSIGISLGVNDFHSRDEYLSPYIFSKTLFSSALSYKFKTNRTIHQLDATYSTGHPNSSVQPRKVTENIGSLSYSISRIIAVKHIARNPMELSLGAGVSTFLLFTNFNAIDQRYNYVWNEQSWYCSNALNLYFGGEYQIHNHNSILFQFSLPVFSLISRPENGHIYSTENQKVIDHFLNVESQGKPEWLWENASLACDLGFKQQLGNHCKLKLNYLLNYITSDRPLQLQMYMNRFLVGFEFLF